MLFLKNIPITKQSTKKNWKKGLIIALITIFLLSSTLLLFRFFSSQGQVSAAPTSAIVSFGSNANGLLGNGTDSNVYSHAQVSNINNIYQASAGYQHSLAVRSDGTVWAWGSNGSSQLGLLTAAPISTAVQIPGLNNIVKVIAAHDGSYAIEDNGVLWKWGDRPFDGGIITTPTIVSGLPPIIDFDATRDFQIAVTASGQVYSWGKNDLGHVGNGSVLPATVTTPTLNTTLTNVKEVSIDGQTNIGISHILALKNDGTLFAWGGSANIFTNCTPANILVISGLGTTCTVPSQVIEPLDPSGFLINVRNIANGAQSNYAIKTDSSVYKWSKFAGSGVPTLDPVITPLLVSNIFQKGYSTIVITQANQVYSYGENSFGQLGVGPIQSSTTTPQILPVSGIFKASFGLNHSLLLSTNGFVYGSGDNGNRQVGNNLSATNALTPTDVNSANLTQANIVKIMAAENHVVALRNDGTVWTWGNNEFGQLGIGSSIPRSLIPVQISTLSNITDINTSTISGDGIAGGNQVGTTIARRSDGTAWVWGGNSKGQLGNGTTTFSNIPIQYGTFTNVVQIQANDQNIGVRLSDGTVRLSGNNSYNMLGDGTTTSAFSAAIVAPAITNVINFQISGTEAVFYVRNDNIGYVSGARNSLLNSAPTPVAFVGSNTISSPISNTGCSGYCTMRNGSGAVFLINNFGNSSGTEFIPFSGIPANQNLVQVNYTTVNPRFSWTDSNNIYYSTGNNSFGQSGNGTLSNSTSPAVNFSATTLIGGGNSISFAAGIFVPPIIDNQIAPIVYVCDPESVNSTTTCNFTLPLGFSLPVNFKIGINDAIPGGSCAQNNYNYTNPIPVTCTGVPTGTQAGNQPIFAQIGINTAVNTGETVLIGAQDVQDGNIQNGTCTPSSVQVGATTDCTFPLTGNTVYTMPSGGLRAGITNTTGNASTYVGDSQPCTLSGTNLICNGIPTNINTNLGTRELVIKELTNPNPTYYFGKGSVTVTSRPLDPAIDIPNLDTLASLSCNPSTVVVNASTTCTGTLPVYITPPASPNELKLNVESNPSVICVFAGQVFTCTNLAVGTTTGSRNIQAATGNGVPTNTGETITVGTAISQTNIGNSQSCITTDQATVGAGYTCDFPIIGVTGTIVLPTGGIVARTQQGAVNSANSPICTLSISQPILTCPNIPTTGGTGTFNSANADVGLQIGGSGTFFDKGDIGLVANIAGGKTISSINTGISTDCISSTNIFLSSPVSTCSIPLIGNISNTYLLPTGGVVAKISTAPGQSSNCTISGNTTPQPRLVCTVIPTLGATLGIQDLLLLFNGNTTGFDRSDITLTNVSPILELASGDIPNLKNIASFNCTPDSVVVNSNVSCTGTLPQTKKPPSLGMRVRLEGVAQSISCVFANQNAGATFTCSSLPVGTITGNRNVQAAIGATSSNSTPTFALTNLIAAISVEAQSSTSYVNTGETIIVTAAVIPTVTPRTGAEAVPLVVLIGVLTTACIGVFVLNKKRKISEVQ
jgi:alpha-tubulin suppressor-like RCC1 family protein